MGTIRFCFLVFGGQSVFVSGCLGDNLVFLSVFFESSGFVPGFGGQSGFVFGKVRETPLRKSFGKACKSLEKFGKVQVMKVSQMKVSHGILQD